jgi:N-acetylmuramoyl-L-alanine amidase
MIKRIITASFLLALLVVCISSFTAKEMRPVQKQKLKRIVIDAGHGGSDFGASGKYSNEKTVSLAIAMALQKEIEEQLPEVETYMTRTTDVFDNPIVKANKANDAKGDLFIAIHCNWAPGQKHSEFIGYKTETYKKGKGKKAKTYTRKVKQYKTYYSPSPVKGTETFIWNTNKDEAKKDALKTHEDMFMDSTTLKELQDFEKKDPEKMILYSIKSKQFFDRSARLALTVEEEFKKTGRFSRQAQQRGKGIWVLQAVAMPAILVETGFISNPEEEDYLNSADGQKEVAQVIANAVKRYKYTLETSGIKPGSMTPAPAQK